MNCFYHQTVGAIALCKSCSRALCSGCIAEVGLSCSCRNRCEADVATLNDLAARGRTAYQKTSATHFRAGLFNFLIGSVFVLLGGVGVSKGTDGEWGYFFLLMGILFAGFGVSSLVSAKKWRQK